MTNNIPFQTQQPIFHKVGNIAELVNMTPEELHMYNISIDTYRTAYSVMENERKVGYEKGHAEGIQLGIEKGLRQGREEGREEGLQQGREEGLQQGREQGREEERKKSRQDKLSIAYDLVSIGLDAAFIAKTTGLTIDEVKALQHSK